MSETTQRLWAVRGAVQVEANDADAILAATEELVAAVMDRNELLPEAMVSCIFTVTPDLDAQFPAVAARQLGLEAVPLLCAREVPVPGAMPRVIRLLLHYYAAPGHEPEHAYLGDTQTLRSDLHSAQ
jgi:chorismate mutase